MVIIRNREDITYYGRVRFGDKGKNCLEKQQAFFDESVSEYKNTMKHFCFECMVRLLRLFSCDLNRITHDCIVLRKKMKNNRCYCSIHCLFPLFDSSSSEYKASISAFFGHFLQFFFLLSLHWWIHLYPFYKKMSIWYRERTGIISDQSEPVQTFGGGYIPTSISLNLIWW